VQPSTSPAVTPARPAFTERLWPGTAGWLTVVGLAAMLTIALVPVGPVWGVAGGLVGLVGGLTTVLLTADRVTVTGGELVAGAAHVPVALLRDPVALDAAATRHALGPGLDARAHLAHRGWVRTAVRVTLVDEADPTPCWIVSTRRPEALVAALRDAGAGPA
jgi:hypothetical protein